jgi:hypothetical protein
VIQFPRAIIRQAEIERFFLLGRKKREAEAAYQRARRDNHRLSISKYGFDRAAAEERRRGAERYRARKAWQELRHELARRLDEGAEVEAGVHTIRLDRRQRVGVAVPTEYKRLWVS